jgi:hypothetical protein
MASPRKKDGHFSLGPQDERSEQYHHVANPSRLRHALNARLSGKRDLPSNFAIRAAISSKAHGLVSVVIEYPTGH